tara:strand:+ start:233 stop:1273 length:1041 start_codon:yes stop_codon:yes gene_type:complete
MKDLYSILGIQRSANDSEIKKAYKKLAFQYHPDKNKELDAQDKFRDISEAYDILTNADKRRMYDNFGYEALEGQNALPINPLDLFQSLFNVDFAGLGEGMQSNIFVFSDLSSGPFLNIQNKMSYNLECSLEELYHGTQKEFEIPHLTSKGRKSTKYIINVKKGSKDGDNIVVKEGGNYIPELNLTEDLVIKVIETPHPKYKRKGNDLIIEEKITLVEALCGVELKIEHLQGPLQVEIKDIVNPNQMFQVFGQGMPIKQEGKALTEDDTDEKEFGNLIIDLSIEFPKSLDDKRKEYLRKIFNHKDRDETSESGTSVQAFHYGNKEDIVKELMNESAEEEEGMGCIQQ